MRNFSLAARGQTEYIAPTQGRGRSSGVEHNLAKVRVVSSNLIARSIYNDEKSDLLTGKVAFFRARHRGAVPLEQHDVSISFDAERSCLTVQHMYYNLISITCRYSAST